MDAGGKSDPGLRFCFKNNNDSTVKTKVISSSQDPIWNQELYMTSQNRDADVLEVDMLDEDIKNDDKIEIPLNNYPIGCQYVFDNVIKRKKKKAGHLHFEIDFEDANGHAEAPGQDVNDNQPLPQPENELNPEIDNQNVLDQLKIDMAGLEDKHNQLSQQVFLLTNSNNELNEQILILKASNETLNEDNRMFQIQIEQLKKEYESTIANLENQTMEI